MAVIKREMAIRASILYYELDKNQDEIARELGISRSYVSQLLHYAKKSGIVKIAVSVDEYDLRMVRMEVDLGRKFPKVRQFYVMRSDSPPFTEGQMGKFAAPYILELIKRARVIGIGVGTSIEKMIQSLDLESIAGTGRKVLVQTLGGLTKDVEVSAHPNELVQRMRHKLNCDYYPLNCPAVIENIQLREALLDEPSIRRGINVWNDIDLTVIGLGPADRRGTLFTLFSADMVRDIESRGACGELNINFFDIHGVYIPILEKNRVSIPYELLKKIPTKVVIGYGEHKIKAILGALRGELIDILFTDSLTVEEMLEYESREKMAG
jgi:deoxyribonucleoside regulator